MEATPARDRGRVDTGLARTTIQVERVGRETLQIQGTVDRVDSRGTINSGSLVTRWLQAETPRFIWRYAFGVRVIRAPSSF